MYTIGIDIGGTKIKFGMFDGVSKLVKEDQISTPKEAIVEKLIAAIKEMIQDQEIHGIGVASAGIVDFQNGVVRSCPNLDALANIPIQDMLEDAFHVPVVISNDANCATMAEGTAGVAKTVSSYICITLGTGIGGGIVHNNELVHGNSGYGGEVGHMILVPNGIICGCGRKGCWEAYASGKALERMISEAPELASKNYQPKDVFQNYTFDTSCKCVVDQYLEYLSIGLINLQYLFDPEMIVIGGGVIDSSKYWWSELEGKMAAASVPIVLQQAHLKNNASMIGASLLVKQDK
ncbi:ROK family protein [Gracilibacillus salitolerans]|uniref:ROK family protein n=1 Tax=Gracilibacillus salitolerans TaxID=2663022 RepID=A0A5Q2TFP3_9BACI|nr:ROK family protein [Gracilibacillus salitolerans]QGH33476.1 ROK family protein [Gracilibacillus salitolerans]